jgi:hypothetical protein
MAWVDSENITTLDRPPAGWFALDVMQKEARKWDWVALMVDVHPDELKHCLCKVAFLFVHPNEYKPDGSRTAREAWVRVPRQAQDQGCRLGNSREHDRHAALRWRTGAAIERPVGHSLRRVFACPVP